jgi:hypothetical protein
MSVAFGGGPTLRGVPASVDTKPLWAGVEYTDCVREIAKKTTKNETKKTTERTKARKASFLDIFIQHHYFG